MKTKENSYDLYWLVTNYFRAINLNNQISPNIDFLDNEIQRDMFLALSNNDCELLSSIIDVWESIFVSADDIKFGKIIKKNDFLINFLLSLINHQIFSSLKSSILSIFFCIAEYADSQESEICFTDDLYNIKRQLEESHFIDKNEQLRDRIVFLISSLPYK